MNTHVLQIMTCSQTGCDLILDKASALGMDHAALAASLFDVIERAKRPEPVLGVRGDLKAVAVLANLFGRNEDGDEGAIHIDAAFIKEIVEHLGRMVVDGTDNGNVQNQIQTLESLTTSDGNTQAVVDAGALDILATALTQSPDVVQARVWSFQYPVPGARERAAAVILNLALSEKTAAAVVAHEGLRKAIDHALGDTENLTKNANQHLNDALFQFDMVGGKGKEKAEMRQAAVEKSDKHVMLSYCWAQQPAVMRIRQSLGDLGYKVWLDVEQMEGSTVDAMADAIDRSYAVCYGVSLECERPIHPAAFLLVWLR